MPTGLFGQSKAQSSVAVFDLLPGRFDELGKNSRRDSIGCHCLVGLHHDIDAGICRPTIAGEAELR